MPAIPDFIEVIPEIKEHGVRSNSNDEVAAPESAPKRVRRLKADEVVSHGDFVGDGRQGLEPWSGPGGFRADAFLKPIYRLLVANPRVTKKTK